MANRRKLFTAIAAALLVVLIGGGLVWYFVIRSDAPDKVSLAGAIGSIATSTPSGSGTSTAASGATAAPSVVASTAANGDSTSLPGTWTPDTTQANFLGYRVVEDLVRIGANTAVGRTSAVTGKVVIAGDSVTSGTITADLTQLKSDSNMRDGQLRNQAIQTSQFPNATFELSQPVALDASLAAGQQISTTLNGKFTLHGVTKDIAIPAQAQLKNGLLVVVGSIDIKFSDYNVSKPNGNSVISIEDHGVMEFQLFLKKS
ncbi:MAG: YceI family protein [Tepidiformaceae bacterium]